MEIACGEVRQEAAIAPSTPTVALVMARLKEWVVTL